MYHTSLVTGLMILLISSTKKVQVFVVVVVVLSKRAILQVVIVILVRLPHFDLIVSPEPFRRDTAEWKLSWQ